MKKMSRFLIFIVISFFMLGNSVFANTIAPNSPDKQSPEVILNEQSANENSDNYAEDELNQIREIHKNVVEQGGVILNTDGTIIIKTDASTLGINEDIFNKYVQSIININNIIELGVASFDDEFELNVKSQDEVSNIIYDRDKELNNEESNNPYDTQIDEMTIQRAALPTLYACSKAKSNKKIIKDLHSELLIYNPSDAYNVTVGYWVAKVKSGGAWDYKSVSGYSPYSKKWTAVQRYTTSTKTSEWFGNYNYAFTGRYIFSLNTLLMGGNAASWGIDSAEDKAAIKQGYNESSGL